MKLYLALIITLCQISLTLIKRNPLPKEETTKLLFIGNSNLYCNSYTEIVHATIAEKFPNKCNKNSISFGSRMTMKEKQHLTNITDYRCY